MEEEKKNTSREGDEFGGRSRKKGKKGESRRGHQWVHLWGGREEEKMKEKGETSGEEDSDVKSNGGFKEDEDRSIAQCQFSLDQCDIHQSIFEMYPNSRDDVDLV